MWLDSVYMVILKLLNAIKTKLAIYTDGQSCRNTSNF